MRAPCLPRLSTGLLVAIFCACDGGGADEQDARARADASRDAGPGGMDARPDSGVVDTGTPDSGGPDSGGQDAMVMDAIGMDATPMDALPQGDAGPVTLRLVSISDWHGQLDPLTPTTGTIAVGGAAVLSAYFQQERMANPNTIVVTAGDAFGGTPPLAGFFNEEPAVRALNLMGIEVDTFGNHNFDRGTTHLQQMIDLAEYTYVSSNLGNLAGNLDNVASPFHLIDVGGVSVAFIGITNDDAPDLVFPGRFGSITVQPSAAAAQSALNAARAAGADVFVALVHMGASTLTGTASGPLIDFARAVNGFHVIFGDHTDIELNMVVNGQRVIENRSKGRTFARVELVADPRNGGVNITRAEIVSPLVNRVRPDPAVESMLAPYRMQLSMLLDTAMGTATGIFPRGGNIERLGEAAIGNLVTDAMRSRYGTQIAFTNGGGLRAPIPSPYLPANMALRRNSPNYAMGPPYDLVLGDAHTVLPFGNAVVTRTVTGAQIWASAENGVSAMPAANGRFMQVSGFRFTYTASAAPGSRVISVQLDDGTPVLNDTATTYTAAVMDFINSGGDGYTALADGRGTSREIAADVVAQYITLQGTVTPTISGRINRVFCAAPRSPVAGDLVVNEFLADPAAADGDANGDGTRDATQDELIEIVNTTGAILDLAGVVLSDAVTVRHTFSGRLSCGGSIVVFGGGNTQSPSWQPNWVTASGGMLGLNNGGDTISLGASTSSTTNLSTYTYGAEGGMDESLVRETELSPAAPFILHRQHPSAGGRRFSPGTRVDGRPF